MFCNALVSLLTQPQPVSLTTRSCLSDWYNVLVIATQVHRCTHLTGDRLLQLWLLLDDLTRTWSVRPFYMEEGEEALPYPSSCLNRLRFACLWCLSDGVSVATNTCLLGCFGDEAKCLPSDRSVIVSGCPTFQTAALKEPHTVVLLSSPSKVTQGQLQCDSSSHVANQYTQNTT